MGVLLQLQKTERWPHMFLSLFILIPSTAKHLWDPHLKNRGTLTAAENKEVATHVLRSPFILMGIPRTAEHLWDPHLSQEQGYPYSCREWRGCHAWAALLIHFNRSYKYSRVYLNGESFTSAAKSPFSAAVKGPPILEGGNCSYQTYMADPVNMW